MPKYDTSTLDEFVAELRLDNDNFEKGAKETISTLQKLEKALKVKGDSSAIDDISKSIQNFDVSPMINKFSEAADFITGKASFIQRAIKDVRDAVYGFGKDIARDVVIEPVAEGMEKYTTLAETLQTLIAGTRDYYAERGIIGDRAILNELVKPMEMLQWYSDETSYAFNDMASTMAKFVSFGVPIEEAAQAIVGIATLSAAAGADAKSASHTMQYAWAQAFGTGFMGLNDFKTLENQNIATKEFKENLMEVAVEMGKLSRVAKDGTHDFDDYYSTITDASRIDANKYITGLTEKEEAAMFNYKNMRESLKDGWATTDVLTALTNKYGEFSVKLYDLVNAVRATGHELEVTDARGLLEKFRAEAEHNTEDWEKYAKDIGLEADELIRYLTALDNVGWKISETGFYMGQEYKTWNDVLSATRDAVSSQWMKTFEHIFGDFLEAKELWSEVGSLFWDVFVSWNVTRNNILKQWHLNGGREALLGIDEDVNGIKGALWNLVDAISDVISPITEAFSEVFGFDDTITFGDNLIALTEKFKAWTAELGPSEEAMTGIKTLFTDVFSIVKTLLGWGGKLITFAGELYSKAIHPIFDMLLSGIPHVREFIVGLWNALTGKGDFNLEDFIFSTLGNLATLGERAYDYWEKVTEWLDSVKERISAAYNKVKEFFGLTETPTRDMFGMMKANGNWSAFDKIKKSITDAIPAIGRFQKNLAFLEQRKDSSGLNSFQNALIALKWTAIQTFDSFKEKLATLGIDINPILEKITSGFEKLKSIGSTVLAPIIDRIEEFKRRFDTLGRVEGLTNTQRAFLALRGTIQTTITKINKQLDKLGITDFFERISETINKIKENVQSLFSSKISFSDFLTNTFEALSNVIPKAEDFNKILSKITGGFKKLFPTLKQNGDWSSMTKGMFPTKAGEEELTIIDRIIKAFEAVKAYLTNPDNIFGQIGEIFSTIAEGIGIIVDGLFGDIDKEALKQNVKEFLSAGIAGAQEFFSELSIEDLLNVGKMALSIAILSRMATTIQSIKRVAQEAQGLSTNLNGVLIDLSKTFRANSYLKIAVAIGAIAGSMYLISKIPADQLSHVAGAMIGLVLALSLLAKVVSGNGSKNAFEFFSKKINDYDIASGNTFQHLIDNFGNSNKLIEKLTFNIIPPLAANLIALAAIMGVVAYAVVQFKEHAISIDDEGVKAALIAIGGVVAAIIVMLGLVSIISSITKKNKPKEVIESFGFLAGTAVLIWSITQSLIKLKDVPWQSMITPLLGFAVVIAAMSLIFKNARYMVSNPFNLGVSFLAMALSLRTLVKPLTDIVDLVDRFDWQKVLVSLGTLAGLGIVLAGLAVATRFLKSEMILKGAVAILAASVAIRLIVNPLISLTQAIDGLNSSTGSVLLSIGALAGLAIVIAGLAYACTQMKPAKLIPTAIGMLILAAAMKIMSGALVVLADFIVQKVATVNWDATAEKIAGFSMSLGTLVALAASVIAFAFAIKLAGEGFMKFGVGVLAAAGGAAIFSLAVLGIAVAIGILSVTLPAFVRMLGTIADVVIENAQGLIKLAGMIVVGIAAAIIAKKLYVAKAFSTLLLTGLQVITAMSPQFLPVIASLLSKLLGFLNASMTPLVNGIISIVLIAIEAIVAGLRSNEARIFHAITDLFSWLAEMLGKGLVWMLGSFSRFIENTLAEMAAGIFNKIPEGIRNALGLNWDATQWAADVRSDSEAMMKNLMSGADSAAASFREYFVYPYEEAGHDVGQAFNDALAETIANPEVEEPVTYVTGTGGRKLQNRTGTKAGAQNEKAVEKTAGEESGAAFAEGYTQTATTGVDDAKEQILGIVGTTKDDIKASFADAFSDFSLTDAMLGTSPDEAAITSEFGQFDFSNIGNQIASSIGTGVSENSSDILAGLSGLFANGDFSIESFLLQGQQMGIDFSSYVGDGATMNASALYQAILDMARTSEDGLASAQTDFNTIGYNLAIGAANGLIEGSDVAVQAAGQMGSEMASAFASATGVASPSKVFASIAHWFAPGVAEGIAGNEGVAIQSVTALGDQLIQAIQNSMAQVAAMTSQDFAFQPQITPVVDMSNVRAGAAEYSSLFSGGRFGTMGMYSGISRSIQASQRAQQAYNSMLNSAPSANTSPTDSIVVNVYAAEGQSEESIADSVINRISAKSSRRSVAFG